MCKVRRVQSAYYTGFTLAEVLLAMLITSVLILGINTAYRQAYFVWSDIELKRPVYNNVRLINETLQQELSCLYFPPKTDGEKDAGSSFKLLNIPNEGTELTFYTLTPTWKGSLESSCMAKVHYRFSKNANMNTIVLERYERPCGGEKIIGEESSDIIATNLSEFRVWVYDPNASAFEDKWIESYESQDKPPKALKVFLRRAATEKMPEAVFNSCILIPSDTPLL